MSEFAKKVMDKIKVKDIKKIPEWHFLLKRIFIWCSLAVAVLLGAFAVSMVIFQLANVDWEVMPRLPHGPIPFFFRAMPYFWAAVSVLLFVFVYFDFKHTRKGYRYGAGTILGVGIILSLVIGIGIYSFKASERADVFLRMMPPYRRLNMDREKMWVSPENGLLGGKVVSVQGTTMMVLEDFGKEMWNVDMSAAVFMPPDTLNVGDNVRLIGEMKKVGEFSAFEVKPFRRGQDRGPERGLELGQDFGRRRD